MSGFGELVFESSRAFPDDEEEEEGISQNSITFEATPAGDQFMKELESLAVGNVYFFHGRVACGFGSGFLKDEQFVPFGSVYYGGFYGIVDSLLSRPERRPIIKLYHGPGRIVFALVDTYGLPRSLSNEVVQVIFPLLEAAKNTIIFHSEPIFAFRGEGEFVQGRLFHLRSSSVLLEASSIFKTVQVLPQPNIIFGITAAVMTQCEARGKTGVLLLTYCETELIDSISTKPFFDALEKGNGGLIDIKKDFVKLIYSPARSSKCNVTPVANSNLYT